MKRENICSAESEASVSTRYADQSSSCIFSSDSDSRSVESDVDNPFSTAGRPLYETKIDRVEMIGVADPNGELSAQASGDESETGSGALIAVVVILVILGAGCGYVVVQNNTKQEAPIYDAVLIEEKDTSNTT